MRDVLALMKFKPNQAGSITPTEGQIDFIGRRRLGAWRVLDQGDVLHLALVAVEMDQQRAVVIITTAKAVLAL